VDFGTTTKYFYKSKNKTIRNIIKTKMNQSITIRKDIESLKSTYRLIPRENKKSFRDLILLEQNGSTLFEMKKSVRALKDIVAKLDAFPECQSTIFRLLDFFERL
jgi:hypothetical protein